MCWAGSLARRFESQALARRVPPWHIPCRSRAVLASSGHLHACYTVKIYFAWHRRCFYATCGSAASNKWGAGIGAAVITHVIAMCYGYHDTFLR